MKTVEAICEVLKREGIKYLIGYPVNHILEYAARADIRPIIVRQERVGLHMADAISRLSSGENIGVFVMQHGPGSENAFGGVAQAYGESVPILVMPMGYAQPLAHIDPNFNSVHAMRSVTKSAEPLANPAEVAHVMRRAFSNLRSGRGGPALVEVPTNLMFADAPDELEYTPTRRVRYGPDIQDIKVAAKLLLAAKNPVIYAGQGVHYAKAWPQLKRLAELLACPVTTSLGGKSAFPENHPLSLGSCGLAIPLAVRQYLDNSDVIFGIGCSFTRTSFGTEMPEGKSVIHATLDPMHINKDIPVTLGIAGDAALVLDALLGELESKLEGSRSATAVAADIARTHAEWLAQWQPRLSSDETPLSPYRVIADLQSTVDKRNTIITHDAGSPRDQLSPFWQAIEPLSYIGWGKTTQLGYGLGLAMGAKLAYPEKLCINVWGDAAIGFTGMDFETAVRERIPILSILFNNFSMAIELGVMPESTKKYRSTDISGDYAAMARAFGAYGERVTEPAEIIPAIKRGIEQTEQGLPALVEFITAKETHVSRL